MTEIDLSTPTGAVFDKDRSHRYALWRRIHHDPLSSTHGNVLFIGLNPSIGDELWPDSTVTRCLGFADRWGYGNLLMGNLYSKVSVHPKGIDISNTVDPDNFQKLLEMNLIADLTIAAWGGHADPGLSSRASQSLSNDRDLYCLGRNKNGSPKHPLYLRRNTVPVIYRGRSND